MHLMYCKNTVQRVKEQDEELLALRTSRASLLMHQAAHIPAAPHPHSSSYLPQSIQHAAPEQPPSQLPYSRGAEPPSLAPLKDLPSSSQPPPLRTLQTQSHFVHLQSPASSSSSLSNPAPKKAMHVSSSEDDSDSNLAEADQLRRQPRSRQPPLLQHINAQQTRSNSPSSDEGAQLVTLPFQGQGGRRRQMPDWMMRAMKAQKAGNKRTQI
jgi:hypothetical protein